MITFLMNSFLSDFLLLYSFILYFKRLYIKYEIAKKGEVYMKIAILAGKPNDGTILPKKESFLWKEICRVMEDDLSLPIFKNATFLIPIYNKFDLHALRIAEEQSNPVEYYVPTIEWGNKFLPAHQKKLIDRMKFHRNVIPSSHKRMVKMIEDADVIYCLPNTEGFDRFKSALVDKTVCQLDLKKMNFTTEEGGKEYQEMLKINMEIHLQTLDENELDENGLNVIERMEKMFADADLSL